MFNLPLDERLSRWASFRSELDNDSDPITTVWEFWKSAPFTPYNNRIDPYFPFGWPTPWEIIRDNVYDDFTKALMIGWTLKLTGKFSHSLIELRTFIDSSESRQYNITCVDNVWAINYNDNGPEFLDKLPCSVKLQNLIELKRPK